jgi:hypothetical protein
MVAPKKIPAAVFAHQPIEAHQPVQSSERTFRAFIFESRLTSHPAKEDLLVFWSKSRDPVVLTTRSRIPTITNVSASFLY